MSDNNFTRVTGSGAAVEDGKSLKAFLTLEKRMGRPVESEKINILFGNQMLVGRDQDREIFLDDDRISRKHALIRIDPDAVRFSDLGSTNGSTRNNDPVTDEIILQTGDMLRMGRARTFEVRIVEKDDQVSSVRLASGADAFLLVPEHFIIGFADPRADEVDFKIYDPQILPRHAKIEFFAGQTFILSLDPEKPVIVDSKPVKEIEIKNNNLIEIGDTALRFERPG